MQPVVDTAEPVELVREVGDDLRPLRTGQPVNGFQPFLHVHEQTIEDPAGHHGIGVDQLEVGRGGALLRGSPKCSLDRIGLVGLVQSQALLAPDSYVGMTPSCPAVASPSGPECEPTHRRRQRDAKPPVYRP